MRARLKSERDPAAEEAGNLLRRLCDAGLRIAACGGSQICAQVRIGLVIGFAGICGYGRGKFIA